MKNRQVAIDSSSAIILNRAGLYELTASLFSPVFSESVYDELTVPEHQDSGFFISAVIKGLTDIIGPPTAASTKRNMEKLSRLGTGERDTILLFLAGKASFIIIDDKKGSIFCKENEIPYVNALLVPKLLLYSSCLSPDECSEFMEKIIAIGRYSQWVIDSAMAFGERELNFFINQ